MRARHEQVQRLQKKVAFTFLSQQAEKIVIECNWGHRRDWALDAISEKLVAQRGMFSTKSMLGDLRLALRDSATLICHVEGLRRSMFLAPSGPAVQRLATRAPRTWKPESERRTAAAAKTGRSEFSFLYDNGDLASHVHTIGARCSGWRKNGPHCAVVVLVGTERNARGAGEYFYKGALSSGQIVDKNMKIAKYCKQ